MKLQMDEKDDCNCNSDCCQPPKGKLWKKILFIVIILSALAIVGIKLIGKNNAQAVQSNNKIEQSSCCDTTGIKGDIKITNPEKVKSCCKQTKK